jgi:hypothetical protein
MMRNGIAYRLPPLVPRIFGTESSFWPTPRATEIPNGKNVQGGLGLTSKVLSGWIPTPRAADGKGATSPTAAAKARERIGGCNLPEFAAESAGGGKLNPMWVEWLMGFPLGWTDCEDSETQSSRKSQNGSAGE